MKKKIGVLGIWSFVLVMILFFTGCGKQTANGGVSNEILKGSPIKIEDIDWNVYEGSIDGERYVLLDYTNNSDYTLLTFAIIFSERPDLTDEERVTVEEVKVEFASKVQEQNGWSDERIEELKGDKFSMGAGIEKAVNPGETTENNPFYYYGENVPLFFHGDTGYVKDINQYDYVEPVNAVIRYLDGEQIYTVKYDWVSKKYTTDEEVVNANYWTKTDLGDKIPKPEDKIIVEDGNDDESNFDFKVYGYSLEEFSSYVEECKTLGYTVNPSDYDDWYDADNDEGYNIDIRYDSYTETLSVRVFAPNN